MTHNEISANEGIGVLVAVGAQISIARNTIEGNGGPGIFAWDVSRTITLWGPGPVFQRPGNNQMRIQVLALSVVDNYFESNCESAEYDESVLVLTPLLTHGGPNKTSAGPLTPNADIVISGAPPPFYGASNPVRSVRIAGSFFSPLANGSLVLLIAAVDVVLEGNDKSAPSAPEPSVSLVTTGPGEDGRLFDVSGEVTPQALANSRRVSGL